MSHSNFIKILFDLQDPNLYFLEENIQKVMKKDSYSKVLKVTLTKEACACPHCKSMHTVNNSFKTSLVRFLPFQEYPIHISLKKQRFLCRNCKRSFLLETSLVKKQESISRLLKLSVLKDLQKNLCPKYFALMNLNLQKMVIVLCLFFLWIERLIKY